MLCWHYSMIDPKATSLSWWWGGKSHAPKTPMKLCWNPRNFISAVARGLSQRTWDKEGKSVNRNGLRLHGRAALLIPGCELSSAVWHWSITSRCRQIITLMTFSFFTHSTWAGEQHVKPHNTSAKLCFTSSQPHFQGRFHLQITTSCTALTLSMSCCVECAFLLKLFSAAGTVNPSTPQIGLGSELQSEFLYFRKQSKPRCLITQSATGAAAAGTGFQPVRSSHSVPKIWHLMASLNF